MDEGDVPTPPPSGPCNEDGPYEVVRTGTSGRWSSRWGTFPLNSNSEGSGHCTQGRLRRVGVHDPQLPVKGAH